MPEVMQLASCGSYNLYFYLVETISIKSSSLLLSNLLTYMNKCIFFIVNLINQI